MRKLASIQTISQITPIPKADFVDMALINGYECVVKKGQFNVGDKIVYIECDSLVPPTADFEFLKDIKYKVKIRKFKGQVSMGLVMPLSILPQDHPVGTEIGTDVTEILDIRNYVKMQEDDEENQLTVSNKKQSRIKKILFKNSVFRKIYLHFVQKEKGNYPQGISKTDETRIQSTVETILEHWDEPWYITEKLDGSSCTIFQKTTGRFPFKKRIFGVCSRNIWLKTPNNSDFWKIARKYPFQNIFSKYREDITIQGELVGKPQKNPYKLEENDIYIFNFLKNGRRLSWDYMAAFTQMHDLKTVPLIDDKFVPSKNIDSQDTKTVVNYLLKLSEGTSKLYNTPREGIVVRLISDPNVSFKVINPTYLLGKS